MLPCTTVAEYCKHGLMFLLSSALFGGTVDATHVCEGDTALTASGILLPLSSADHPFVSGVWLIVVLLGRHFDYKQTYLADYQSFKVDCVDQICFGRFLYTH